MFRVKINGGVKVEKEKRVVIKYRGSVIGEYVADISPHQNFWCGDIVADDKAIVELENVDKIISVHKAQLLNYLRACGIEVGLIINFSKPKLEFQRLVV